MFQASRQLFHRSSSSTSAATTATGADKQSQSEEARRTADRHPAMRGLNVSPVHGRHCICQRCEQHDDAA